MDAAKADTKKRKPEEDEEDEEEAEPAAGSRKVVRARRPAGPPWAAFGSAAHRSALSRAFLAANLTLLNRDFAGFIERRASDATVDTLSAGARSYLSYAQALQQQAQALYAAAPSLAGAAAAGVAAQPPAPASRPGGTLYVVGSGDFGQLGLGEDVATRGRPSPLALPTAAPVVAVAAGGLHSLAVTADGELYSWGVNDTYSLGRELPPDADTPAGERCKTAWVPGKVEFPADASPPVRVVAVSTGDGHAVAVDDAGRAWGWGVFVETCGQLAFSPAAAVQATPALMHSPGGADGRRAVAVASGDDHAVLLLRDGTALTAGCAQKGRLGRFAMAAADPAVGEFRGAGAAREALLADRLLFAPVPGLPPLRAVAAGGFATFFVARDGEGGGGGGVYACGLNQCGQLGFPPPPSDPAEGAPAGAGAAALTAAREARDAGRAVYAPRRVSQLDGKSVVALFPGQHHTLALTASGALLSAGRADGGRLGRAAAAAGVQAGDGLHEFAPVDGLDAEGGCDPARRAVAASAGVATSACVRGDGAMCAWGYGETAMLGKGDEDEADEAAPRAMAPTRRFPGTGGLAVSLGGQHALWVARAPPGLAGEERDEKRRRQQ